MKSFSDKLDVSKAESSGQFSNDQLLLSWIVIYIFLIALLYIFVVYRLFFRC